MTYQKNSKEKKYPDANGSINVKIGTTNRISPKIIFVDLSAWVMPYGISNDEAKDFGEELNRFLHSIVYSFLKENNDYYNNDNIFDFDFSTLNMSNNQKKFFSLSLFLKCINETNFLEESQYTIERFAPYLNDICTFFEKNNFKIAKSKKSLMV